MNSRTSFELSWKYPTHDSVVAAIAAHNGTLRQEVEPVVQDGQTFCRSTEYADFQSEADAMLFKLKHAEYIEGTVPTDWSPSEHDDEVQQ